MAVNAGLIKDFKIAGVVYSPVGSWTIKPSFTKKELTDSSYSEDYFKQTPQAGMVTGQISIKKEIDTNPVRNADGAEVFIQTVAGKYYSGNMTYTADGEENQDDGTMQIELTGYLKQQS